MELIHFGKGWIGVNFNNKLETLSDRDFFHKAANIHSIAEIMSHLITWRLETILKIKTGRGSITDSDPSNWKNNDELQKIGKKEILKIHEESLFELLELLKNKNDNFLNDLYFDNDFNGNYTYDFIVHGMLHHDIYHLGQIAMLIKFNQSNSSQ